MTRRRLPESIFVRHARGCASGDGARCDCRPTYEASAYVSRDGKRVWRRFPTLAAAKAWRTDSVSLGSRGALRAGATPTLLVASEQVLDGMRDGSVRARGGGRFRASVIREYDGALRRHVLPALGGRKLADMAHADLLDLVDELHAKGLAPSTIRNALDPVRVILRRAVARGQLGANPAAGLELPTGETPRDRVADAAEAAALVAALPRADDRALWACALYAGLRSGELRALRWRHVHLHGRPGRAHAAEDPARHPQRADHAAAPRCARCAPHHGARRRT